MRDYELMVVLDPNLDEAGTEAINARITSIVTQSGGEVQNVEPWGRRRLAYPIGHYREGNYILIRLQITPEVTTEIERALRLTESVMRHLLVRADEAAGTPAPAPA